MENLTKEDSCPIRAALADPPPEIAATLSVLGGKWKILILWQLLRRPCRFGELRRAIKGVSQHMLTLHLRELEQEGILTRTVFAEVPPRVEYALSPHGETLNGVMKALAEWGSSHVTIASPPPPWPSAEQGETLVIEGGETTGLRAAAPLAPP